MTNDNYTIEQRREDFWKYFIKDLKKDVNELDGAERHPLVANSFDRLKDDIGNKENKTLEQFINGWREQGVDYERRITDETRGICNWYKLQLKYSDSMIGEEYINILDARQLTLLLIEELANISPEKAKAFQKELDSLDKELKEKTAPIPKELFQPDKPWYDNRWPIYEIDEYKKRKAKEVN